MSEEIDNIFHKVSDLFTYVSDKENYDQPEHWKQHAAAVNAGEDFTGDCDDFANTCAELLSQAGISDVRIIFCKVETGGGHLVCGVDTEDDTLILDNRQRFVVSAGELSRYEFIKGLRVGSNEWREI